MPSWHLTGDKAMKYITDASERQDAKRTKEEKYDKARREAVSKVKKDERKWNKKVTRLTVPCLNTKPSKQVNRRQ